MKIFVTVGTTKFDHLIKFLDTSLDKSYDVLFQIAEGNYKPINFPYIKYTNNIKDQYDNSDLVICHAGAGSIFELLSLNKSFFAVSNLDRVDKHQLEICQYLKSNNYALFCENYDMILESIIKLNDFNFNKFKKDSFFKFDEIADIIQNLIK